jgi:hypothetical protein
MAHRGTKKELSVRHENHVAHVLGGKRSKSSGASVTDKGDVRANDLVIECKMTMGRLPTFIRQFEKVASEAYEEGLTPMMTLRYYDPVSIISDTNGWIDIAVMLLGDAGEREEIFYADKIR